MFSSNALISDGVFLLIIVFLALAGLAEFYGLAEKRGLACFKWCGLLGGALLMVGTFLNLTGHIGTSGSPARVNDFETGFIILFVLGLCVRQLVSRNQHDGHRRHRHDAVRPDVCAVAAEFHPENQFLPRRAKGKYFLLYFILVTKFSDTGAYAVGSLIGRHKMIPRISPGKTWEGFGGAILVSTGASLVFVHFFGGRMAGMNWLHAMILGVVVERDGGHRRFD